MLQVTALVKSADHVCCRYRLAAFRPFLEEAGYQLTIQPWSRFLPSWMFPGSQLADADVVILQRRLLPGWQLRLLRRAAKRLIFDFDDAVFLRDSYAYRGLYSAVRSRRFSATIRSADLVVAANHFLSDHAALWTPAEQVCTMPTYVDPDRYPLAKHHRAGQGTELVWIGSSSTLRGLERCRPLLERLGTLPGVRLKIICDRALRLRQLSVDFREWSAATETPELAACDVGISWLPDDLWSRGKCSLKVLQYMAAGLPVVANPVGVQAELVRHGQTGFLAETADQWVEAVGRLAGDPELRSRMGQAGRAWVEKEYHVKRGAIQWLRLLDRLTTRQVALPA